MKKYLIIILFIISSPLIGQNSNIPFTSTSLSINYLVNDNRNRFHTYWENDFAAKIDLEMPFYLGFISSGILFSSFESVNSNVPGFSATYYYINFGKRFRTNWISFSLAGGGGIYGMSFEDDNSQVSETLLSESEIAFHIQSQLTFILSKRLSFNFSYMIINIKTKRSISLNYISAGISLIIENPEWLVNILN